MIGGNVRWAILVVNYVNYALRNQHPKFFGSFVENFLPGTFPTI